MLYTAGRQKQVARPKLAKGKKPWKIGILATVVKGTEHLSLLLGDPTATYGFTFVFQMSLLVLPFWIWLG